MPNLDELPSNAYDGHAALKAAAEVAAGSPTDIPRRAVLLHSLYQDSGGNHAFPLIALHGALWASKFFARTGRVGDALRVRYFYNGRTRCERMEMLESF